MSSEIGLSQFRISGTSSNYSSDTDGSVEETTTEASENAPLGFEIQLSEERIVRIDRLGKTNFYKLEELQFVDGFGTHDLQEYCDENRITFDALITRVKDVFRCGSSSVLYLSSEKIEWDDIGPR